MPSRTDKHIRAAFREYLGDERYRRFVRAFVDRALKDGELLYWQKRAWSSFAQHQQLPIPGDVVALREMFTRCCVHDLPLHLTLVPIRKGVTDFYYRPEYEAQWAAAFPYAIDCLPDGPHHNGKSSIEKLRCPKCRQLFQDTLDTTSPAPISK